MYIYVSVKPRSSYLVGQVVLFEPVLLPLSAFGVHGGGVHPVLLQLQTHLLQLTLVTPQLLLLHQSQRRE